MAQMRPPGRQPSRLLYGVKLPHRSRARKTAFDPNLSSPQFVVFIRR
jgi:hypothetical protein